MSPCFLRACHAPLWPNSQASEYECYKKHTRQLQVSTCAEIALTTFVSHASVLPNFRRICLHKHTCHTRLQAKPRGLKPAGDLSQAKLRDIVMGTVYCAYLRYIFFPLDRFVHNLDKIYLVPCTVPKHATLSDG